MVAHAALAVLVAISIMGIIPSESGSTIESSEYLFVPLPPISLKDEFQSGSIIPLKFHLFDPSGAPVNNAHAWIIVNDEPGRSPGNANHFNEFRTTGATYSFNFDTKPYSSGLGTIDLELTIEVMIGFENPIFLWESFDITLL